MSTLYILFITEPNFENPSQITKVMNDTVSNLDTIVNHIKVGQYLNNYSITKFNTRVLNRMTVIVTIF